MPLNLRNNNNKKENPNTLKVMQKILEGKPCGINSVLSLCSKQLVNGTGELPLCFSPRLYYDPASSWYQQSWNCGPSCAPFSTFCLCLGCLLRLFAFIPLLFFFFNFIVDYMNFLGYHKPVQEVFHDPFALWLDIILPFLEGPSFLCWFLCMFWFSKLFFLNILHLNVTCVLGQEVNI